MKYEVLKKHFGYDSFRTGQEEIIESILNNNDVLGIMPTGGGKSLCYQIPALLHSGVTLVISPLIALMKDQVDGLIESGINATYINSTLNQEEYRERSRAIINGEYKIVYVAPERLLTDSFNYIAQNIDISMIAVDEAHCISQWGHDFRPSYKDIPRFINMLDNRPIVAAFTATATRYVVSEIIYLLGLNNPYELTTGFDRANLHYKVVKPQDRFKYIKTFIERQEDGCGIIYCSTRKAVESLSKKLVDNGYNALGYHGGMDNDDRTRIQDSFMMDKTQIIVATNAFGMGIDKPDVRYVIHYNMPKNMEAYYQEAGRAGRDSRDSECILMYSPSDIVKQKLMITQNATTKERYQIQLENLQILVNYCHTNDCLRKAIIEYFGEKVDMDKCDNCGNCNNDSEFIDVTIEAQKILSCIYRTKQRFGVNVIIQVLRGSKNKKILSWDLDKVSTYGIITDYSEGGLRELIMNLIARGFIAMTTDQYPVLKLRESSKAVLKGDEKILMRRERIDIKEKSKKKKKSSSSSNITINDELYDLLVSKRKEICDKKKIPAYIIFHNAALEEMSHYKPVTRESFLEIKGVGEKKFDNYGQVFMDVIKEYVENAS